MNSSVGRDELRRFGDLIAELRCVRRVHHPDGAWRTRGSPLDRVSFADWLAIEPTALAGDALVRGVWNAR
jgi:hypothetical protein